MNGELNVTLFFLLQSKVIFNPLSIEMVGFHFRSFLAFLLLSGDILLMIKNRNVKRALVITSILILTESIISFFVSDYPFMIPNLSILFYISVFPILGYNLIKEDN